MRIQLDLDEEGMKWIEELKEATGLKTHKELFNNSLTLLDWAVHQRQRGRIIASLDERSRDYKELQMPALERAALSEPAPVPKAMSVSKSRD